MGELIDQTAIDIFISHREKLINEPITYIVPAVWGAKKDSDLTGSQRQMNEKTNPAITRIIDSLRVENLSRAQKFAIGSLLRSLIISKVTYMIEAYKNNLFIDTIHSSGQNAEILEAMEPVGTA